MKQLTVKNHVQISTAASKVWAVLTASRFIRQWDELPEDFNDAALAKGTEIIWSQPNGHFTKLTVTEFIPNKLLKINLYGSKWAMPEKAYDIAYTYKLSELNNTTLLETEIGDFSVLPDGENYYTASVDFGQTATLKIKDLSEQS